MAAADVKEAVPSVGTRAVALLVDLGLLFSLALYISSAKLWAEHVLPVLGFVYFAVFPLTPWQGTPGKRLTGIRICDLNGAPLTIRPAAVRSAAVVAWYALPMLVAAMGKLLDIDTFRVAMVLSMLLPVPWVTALFSVRRQTLFDRLVGSFVVFRLGAGETRQAQVTSGRRRSTVVVSVLVVLAFGFLFYIGMNAFEDRDRRGRVIYALTQTEPARDKLLEFRKRENRWPTPAEAGVAEWNPYPAGGGYRVHADGRIVISFSKTPGLMGHDITLRAKPAGEGLAGWNCETDPGFERKYLLASCR